MSIDWNPGQLPDDLRAIIDEEIRTQKKVPRARLYKIERGIIKHLPWRAALHFKLGLASISPLIPSVGLVAAGVAVGSGTTYVLVEKSEPRVIIREVRVEVPVPSPTISDPINSVLTDPAPKKDGPLYFEAQSPPASVRKPSSKFKQDDSQVKNTQQEYLSSANEAPLLDEARIALRSGRVKDAEQAIHQHRTHFPNGKLSELRDVLEIQILLESGRKEAAEKAFAEFTARYTQSVFLPALQKRFYR